jgi:uncharacterized protein (TIGR03435 family)
MTHRILRTLTLSLPIAIGGFVYTTASPVTLQTTAPSHLEFEVASVKPDNSDSGLTAYGCHGTDTTKPMTVLNVQFGPGPGSPQPAIIPDSLGRCSATNAPLKLLIAFAYGLNVGPGQVDQNIVGGPAWLGSTRFDIDAKAENPPVEADLKLMLQALLADRFQLQIHREKREGQGYVLVIGKGGSKLKESTDDKARPGLMMNNNGQEMTLTANKLPMASFVNALSARLGHTVIDQTKLTGTYDFKLIFSPADAPAGASDDKLAPSLFTAIQDELGLKLDSQKVTTEVIVIDRAEKPPQN